VFARTVVTLIAMLCRYVERMCEEVVEIEAAQLNNHARIGMQGFAEV
jgi:hypothetical protein